MKEIIKVLLVILVFSGCEEFKPRVSQFVISGEIENLDAEKIKLVHPLDEIEILLDENGNFSDTIYDFVDGFYRLVAGKEYTNMYIKDGFDIAIKLDVVDFDESITYSGIGALENNFLAQELLNSSNFWSFGNLEEKDFLGKTDSLRDYKKTVLKNAIQTSPEIDKNFVSHKEQEYTYAAALNKENYTSIYKYFHKEKDFVLSDSYYSFREKVQIENSSAKGVSTYDQFVLKYIENQISENDTMEFPLRAVQLINRKIQDKDLKKYFIYKSAKEQFKNVELIDEYWALVSYMVTDKREYKELNKLYKSYKKIAKGEKSPLTTFKDVNDKSFDLQDFKGKYVYIDCWAQWCAPCKREAPFFKKLEEKFIGKEIHFLKISLDTDKKAWKDYIIENQETENSYVLKDGFKSEFAEAFQINSIPRFILLDKELDIMDANAERPSNDEMIDLLDEIL